MYAETNGTYKCVERVFCQKPTINSTFLQDKVGGKYITVLNINCLIKGILIIQREIFISCINISE